MILSKTLTSRERVSSASVRVQFAFSATIIRLPLICMKKFTYIQELVSYNEDVANRIMIESITFFWEDPRGWNIGINDIY